jgi:hypothetical protein
MSVATLPELQHLVSMVNEAYTSLYIRRIDKGGSFLFCTSTSYGSRPIGRNQSEKWIKEVTGHAAGVLRQSIQNHAFDLYIADPIKFDLKALTLCTGRCQHRAETACQKYMTESITKKKERLAQAQVADAVEAIVDQVETEETMDTTEENTEDTVETEEQASNPIDLEAFCAEHGYDMVNMRERIGKPEYSKDMDKITRRVKPGDLVKIGVNQDHFWTQVISMDGSKIVAKLCSNLYTVSEIGGGDIVSFDKMFVHCVMFASSDSEEDTEDTDTEEDTESNSEFEDESDGDEGPGPAVRALIAAFTAAYESDRKRRRR